MPQESFYPVNGPGVFFAETQEQAWLKKQKAELDALQKKQDEKTQADIDVQRALQGLPVLGSIGALLSQQRSNIPQISNDYIDRIVPLGPPLNYYEYQAPKPLALPAGKTYPYDSGHVELDRFTFSEYQKLDKKEITLQEFQQRLKNKSLELVTNRANGVYSPLSEQDYQTARARILQQYDGQQIQTRQQNAKEINELNKKLENGEITLKQYNEHPTKLQYDEFLKQDLKAQNQIRLDELTKIQEAKQRVADEVLRKQRMANEAEVAKNKQLFGPWWETDNQRLKLPGGDAFTPESPWAKEKLTYEQWQQKQIDLKKSAQAAKERLSQEVEKRKQQEALYARKEQLTRELQNRARDQYTQAQLEAEARRLGILPHELLTKQQQAEARQKLKRDGEQLQRTLQAELTELTRSRDAEDAAKLSQFASEQYKEYYRSKKETAELKAHNNYLDQTKDEFRPQTLQEFDDYLVKKRNEKKANNLTSGQGFQQSLFGDGEVFGNPTPKAKPKATTGPKPQNQTDSPTGGRTPAPARKPSNSSTGNGRGFGRDAIPVDVEELERPQTRQNPGWDSSSPGQLAPIPKKRNPSQRSTTQKLNNADEFRGRTIDVTPNRNGTPNNKQGNKNLLPSDGARDRGQIVPRSGPSQIPNNSPINLQQPRNLKRGGIPDAVGMVNDGLAFEAARKAVEDDEYHKNKLAYDNGLTRQQLNDVIKAYNPRKDESNIWDKLFRPSEDMQRRRARYVGYEEGYDWKTDPLGYESMVKAYKRGMSPAAYRRQFGGDDNGRGDNGRGPMGPYMPNDMPDLKPWTGGPKDVADRTKELADDAKRKFFPDPWDNWNNPYAGLTSEEALAKWYAENPHADPNFFAQDPNGKTFPDPVTPPFDFDGHPGGIYTPGSFDYAIKPVMWKFTWKLDMNFNENGKGLHEYYFGGSTPPKIEIVDGGSQVSAAHVGARYLVLLVNGVEWARNGDRGDWWGGETVGWQFELFKSTLSGPWPVDYEGNLLPSKPPKFTPIGPKNIPSEPLPQADLPPQWEPKQDPKSPKLDPASPNRPHPTNPPKPFAKDPPPFPKFFPTNPRFREPDRNPYLSPAPTPQPEPKPKPPPKPKPKPPYQMREIGPPAIDKVIPKIPQKWTTTAPPVIDLFPKRTSENPTIEDDDMPCRYATDTQVPTPIQYFDPITKTRKVQTFMIHEGLDEAIAFLASQIADAKESTHKISSALEADVYYAPTGKPLVPNVQAEVMGTAMFGGAGIVAAKSLPMEMNAWASLNHMLAGHHQLGKTDFPKNLMNPTGDKTKHTTALGFQHWAMDQLTNMIGLPNKHSVTGPDGTKTDQSFKNQNDAIENIHAQNLGMEQDLEALEKYMFKISQSLEMITQVVIQNKYDIDVLIDESGCKTKQKIVDRPGVFTHGKNDKNESFFERMFEKFMNKMVVREWNDEIDAKQLARKTNMEAQVAALSNKFEFDKTDPKLPIVDRTKQNPKAEQDEEWKRYVNTSENPGTVRQSPGLPVPELKEIKLGIDKEVSKPEKDPEKLIGS